MKWGWANRNVVHLAHRLRSRRGEICGLRWSSVDLDRRVLWIRHSVARLRTGKLIEKDPKSHQTREVAIDKNTAQILRDHRERQETLAAMFHTKLDPDGYVIADLSTDPTGLTPISPDRITQAFKRLTARVSSAGDLRLHDLRHWYASTQLDAGESLPAVAARIGDHVDTLARVYAHRGHRRRQPRRPHRQHRLKDHGHSSWTSHMSPAVRRVVQRSGTRLPLGDHRGRCGDRASDTCLNGATGSNNRARTFFRTGRGSIWLCGPGPETVERHDVYAILERVGTLAEVERVPGSEVGPNRVS